YLLVSSALFSPLPTCLPPYSLPAYLQRPQQQPVGPLGAPGVQQRETVKIRLGVQPQLDLVAPWRRVDRQREGVPVFDHRARRPFRRGRVRTVVAAAEHGKVSVEQVNK